MTGSSANRQKTVFLQSGRGKTSEIAALLEKQILSNAYRAGEHLPAERDLAAEFGVSRNTVRGALDLLEQRRLVKTKWGAGTTVLGPEGTVLMMSAALSTSQHELDNVAELRALIEPGIAALAAQRATGADLITMSNIIEKSSTHMQAKESLSIDMSFHLAIARSTGNALIAALLAFANDATKEVRLSSHATVARRETSLEGHRHIFDMLQARDVQGAQWAMEDHLRQIALVSEFPAEHGI